VSIDPPGQTVREPWFAAADESGGSPGLPGPGAICRERAMVRRAALGFAILRFCRDPSVSMSRRSQSAVALAARLRPGYHQIDA